MNPRADLRGAISLYKRGLTMAQVAKKYGVDRRTIARYLKRFGVSHRPYGPSSYRNIKRWRRRTPNWTDYLTKPGSHVWRHGKSRTRVARVALETIEAAGINPKQCEECGRRSYKKRQPIHHKDRNLLNNNIGNLKVLCRGCHNREHLMTDHPWRKRSKKYRLGGDHCINK